MKHLLKGCRTVAACVAMIGLLGMFPLPSTGAVAVNEALSLQMRGDVDQNGSINTTDARKILQHVARKTVTPFSSAAADYDDNGKINTTDARLVLRFAAGFSGSRPRPSGESMAKWGTPPEGTAVTYTCAELIPNTSAGGSGSYALVAQTPAEWATLKAAYNFTSSYNDAFFNDNLLVVADVFLSSTNTTLAVSGLTVSSNTMQLLCTTYHPNPDSTDIARGFAVLEVPRAAVNGVTSVELYIKGVIVDR